MKIIPRYSERSATEVIFPERETANRVAAQIVNPNHLDFIPLARIFVSWMWHLRMRFAAIRSRN